MHPAGVGSTTVFIICKITYIIALVSIVKYSVIEYTVSLCSSFKNENRVTRLILENSVISVFPYCPSDDKAFPIRLWKVLLYREILVHICLSIQQMGYQKYKENDNKYVN